MGIVPVNWWGILFEIEVTLKTVDRLFFFFDVQHWTWFFCTTLKMMRCDCGSSRVLDVSFSYLQVCEKLKQRKPCCERVMYLYIVVHILDPEVHLWSVAILLQTSHLGFVLSHHRPLCSTLEWLWRWFLGNSPPRVYRLLYRPRFVGIVSVNWWGVLFEIEVTLKTVDPLVLFLWCAALDLIFFAPRLKWCVVIAAALACWMSALTT